MLPFLKISKALLMQSEVLLFLHKDYHCGILPGSILHIPLSSLKNGVKFKKGLAFFLIKKQNAINAKKTFSYYLLNKSS